MKKAIILMFQDKPIAVLDYKDLTSAEFVALSKEAEQNLNEFLGNYLKLKKQVQDLSDELLLVEKEILKLKGED